MVSLIPRFPSTTDRIFLIPAVVFAVAVFGLAMNLYELGSRVVSVSVENRNEFFERVLIADRKVRTIYLLANELQYSSEVQDYLQSTNPTQFNTRALTRKLEDAAAQYPYIRAIALVQDSPFSFVSSVGATHSTPEQLRAPDIQGMLKRYDWDRRQWIAGIDLNKGSATVPELFARSISVMIPNTQLTQYTASAFLVSIDANRLTQSFPTDVPVGVTANGRRILGTSPPDSLLLPSTRTERPLVLSVPNSRSIAYYWASPATALSYVALNRDPEAHISIAPLLLSVFAFILVLSGLMVELVHRTFTVVFQRAIDEMPVLDKAVAATPTAVPAEESSRLVSAIRTRDVSNLYRLSYEFWSRRRRELPSSQDVTTMLAVFLSILEVTPHGNSGELRRALIDGYQDAIGDHPSVSFAIRFAEAAAIAAADAGITPKTPSTPGSAPQASSEPNQSGLDTTTVPALSGQPAGSVELAKRILREEFQRLDISLDTVAGRVGVTPQHLSAKFHARTGHTFVEYLTELRLHRACDLLERTALPVSEIAGRCGYKTPQYFARVFQRRMGLTPIEYRRATLSRQH